MTTAGQPWQARELPSVFGVAATAERIGRAIWVEERLFAIVGSWIADASDGAVKERLAAHCHQHAAHVALWRERLPQATGIDGDAMVVCPAPSIGDALDMLSAPSALVVRLAGLYRVVIPRLVAAHTYHRHATNSVTDGPTVAVLRTVIEGLVREWRDGEMIIQTLLASDGTAGDTVSEIASHQASTERAVVAAGGILGVGTLGD